jgi:hypothetical protein
VPGSQIILGEANAFHADPLPLAGTLSVSLLEPFQ